MVFISRSKRQTKDAIWKHETKEVLILDLIKETDMNNFANPAAAPIITGVRWSARILSGLIMLFWGFFLVASLVGDAARSSRPLATGDYIILVTLVISLAGLGVAWKWEFIGAVVTLAATLIAAAVNWRVLVFPPALIPLAASLFLLCWWMNRTRRINSASGLS